MHNDQDRRADDAEQRKLTAAMAEAMREVLTDPHVIEAMGAVAINIIQKQAAQRTGSMLLSLLKAFFTRWILILVLAIVLAQVIGVPAALRALAPAVAKGAP